MRLYIVDGLRGIVVFGVEGFLDAVGEACLVLRVLH